MQIDLAAFADYALNTFDYSELFEEDAFSVNFEGTKVYVERHRSYFKLEIADEHLQLPRF
ncbi:hypothetical protein [Sphingomonas sp. Ag1]|uniref:hypothetical protein n=1 Tax=Sphingomonas sp. Ag1 TaxID=1642949 RepID=UPI000B15C178|nr:hypothetical protein [Sphingomonas sp. Ag1]